MKKPRGAVKVAGGPCAFVFRHVYNDFVCARRKGHRGDHQSGTRCTFCGLFPTFEGAGHGWTAPIETRAKEA